jgi:uncharacterized protein (DUF58 family)
MRLTGAGYRLIFLAIVLFTVGELMGYAVLRVLAGACVAAVAAAMFLVYRRSELEADRVIYPERVERGGASVARLRVRNSGKRATTPFTATEQAGAKRVPVAIPSLTAGRSARRTYLLPTDRRGVLQIGPLILSRQDPLGLARAELRSGSRVQLWVHPKTYPVRAVTLGRSRQYEGLTRQSSPRGTQVFHALREYVIGDDVRQIHWRTTARTGALMVREHLDPHAPDLTIVLDTQRRALSDDQFEEAVDFAASLVRAAGDHAYPIRLMTTSGIDLRTRPGHVSAIALLDALCEVRQGSTDGRPLRALLGRHATGSCLAFVGGGVNDAQIAELARMRPRFGLVAAIDMQPDAASVAASSVLILKETSAEQAAVTWNSAAPV